MNKDPAETITDRGGGEKVRGTNVLRVRHMSDGLLRIVL